MTGCNTKADLASIGDAAGAANTGRTEGMAWNGFTCLINGAGAEADVGTR